MTKNHPNLPKNKNMGKAGNSVGEKRDKQTGRPRRPFRVGKGEGKNKNKTKKRVFKSKEFCEFKNKYSFFVCEFWRIVVPSGEIRERFGVGG